jgi:hypothetical protein
MKKKNIQLSVRDVRGEESRVVNMATAIKMRRRQVVVCVITLHAWGRSLRRFHLGKPNTVHAPQEAC